MPRSEAWQMKRASAHVTGRVKGSQSLVSPSSSRVSLAVRLSKGFGFVDGEPGGEMVPAPTRRTDVEDFLNTVIGSFSTNAGSHADIGRRLPS